MRARFVRSWDAIVRGSPKMVCWSVRASGPGGVTNARCTGEIDVERSVLRCRVPFPCRGTGGDVGGSGGGSGGFNGVGVERLCCGVIGLVRREDVVDRRGVGSIVSFEGSAGA